jgi:hypothetical protein
MGNAISDADANTRDEGDSYGADGSTFDMTSKGDTATWDYSLESKDLHPDFRQASPSPRHEAINYSLDDDECNTAMTEMGYLPRTQHSPSKRGSPLSSIHTYTNQRNMPSPRSPKNRMGLSPKCNESPHRHTPHHNDYYENSTYDDETRDDDGEYTGCISYDDGRESVDAFHSAKPVSPKLGLRSHQSSRSMSPRPISPISPSRTPRIELDTRDYFHEDERYHRQRLERLRIAEQASNTDTSVELNPEGEKLIQQAQKSLELQMAHANVAARIREREIQIHKAKEAAHAREVEQYEARARAQERAKAITKSLALKQGARYQPPKQSRKVDIIQLHDIGDEEEFIELHSRTSESTDYGAKHPTKQQQTAPIVYAVPQRSSSPSGSPRIASPTASPRRSNSRITNSDGSLRKKCSTMDQFERKQSHRTKTYSQFDKKYEDDPIQNYLTHHELHDEEDEVRDESEQVHNADFKLNEREPLGEKEDDFSVQDSLEQSLDMAPEDKMARKIMQARIKHALLKGSMSNLENQDEMIDTEMFIIPSLQNSADSRSHVQEMPDELIGDIDINFVQQYENAFDQFVKHNITIMAKHPELIYNLRVAKLQKLLQVTQDAKQVVRDQIATVEQEKRQLLVNHKKGLIEAARKKAALEIRLRQELSTIDQATLTMTGRLTWQLITENHSRAKRHYFLLQTLSRQKVSPQNLLALLPDNAHTRAILDATNAPTCGALSESQRKDLRQFQVDNAFLNAEVNVLEKKLAHEQTNAKKFLWVDSVFNRMESKEIKKLKGRFQKNLGVKF